MNTGMESLRFAKKIFLPDELSRIGVSRRYHDFLLKDMTWLSERTIATLREYLVNIGKNIESGRGLVLSGSYGVGKTAILVMVAKAAMYFWQDNDLFSNRSAKYITAYELCRACARDDEMYYRMKRTSLLLIDDFGAEYAHDWPLSTFNAIIDQRYANFYPTCIATNISAARMANIGSEEYAKYGRLIDRMNQSDSFLLVEINAKSQRK